MRIINQIWQGKTLLRAMMHNSLSDIKIGGDVIDIGGGRNPEYFRYFIKSEGLNVTPVDLHLKGDGVILDLEKDNLPFVNSSKNIVLIFNLLEHIFNHQHVVNESNRVLEKQGMIIGFVPFLIQYHPDPHDYFRYTKESLKKILEIGGFSDIDIRTVGGGPFLVNFNNIVLSIPRILRVAIYPLYFFLDYIFLKLRPMAKERYPLGYLFLARK